VSEQPAVGASGRPGASWRWRPALAGREMRSASARCSEWCGGGPTRPHRPCCYSHSSRGAHPPATYLTQSAGRLGYTRLCDGARFNLYKGFVAVRCLICGPNLFKLLYKVTNFAWYPSPLRTPGRTQQATYATPTPTDWNRSPDPACRPPCRTVTQPTVRSLYLSMRVARM
jgi:hypothetical protein